MNYLDLINKLEKHLEKQLSEEEIKKDIIKLLEIIQKMEQKYSKILKNIERKLKQQHEDKARRYHKLDKINKELKGEVAILEGLNKKYDDLKLDLEEIENKKKSVEEKLNDFNKNNQEAIQSCDPFKQIKNDYSSSDLSSITNKLSTIENEFLALNSEKKILESKIKTLKNKETDLETKIIIIDENISKNNLIITNTKKNLLVVVITHYN